MLDTVAKALLDVTKLFVASFIWSVVLFNLGRIGLLVVTFGKFPRERDLERNVNLLSAAGIVVLSIVWLSVALYNNLAAPSP